MTTAPGLATLVALFAESVGLQDEAIRAGDATRGNAHATKYLEAWTAIKTHGEGGRNALMQLFAHPSRVVRITAATFLLSHCETEARAVLNSEVDAGGFEGFAAEQALQRWKEDPTGLDG